MISNSTEWLFTNLDLIEECNENGKKPVVLIAGASSSGKSYVAKMLERFLNDHDYRTITVSTDSYNNGIAKNMFNAVDKKYYGGKLPCKDICINKIRDIIINSEFGKKFDYNNCRKIERALNGLLNINLKEFTDNLKFEFDHINFDHKDIYDLNEASTDIAYLMKGKIIAQKSYSKMISEREETSNFIDGRDVDVILVEGIYALTNDIKRNLDPEATITNFVNANSKNLFLRRMIRDSQITNCSKSFILKNYFNFVIPEYFNTVKPTMHKADIVFENDMTYEELRTGEIEIQEKFVIDEESVKVLLKHSKVLDKKFQMDTFFGSKNDLAVLRLREVGMNRKEMTMKNLIFKSAPKFRKDNQIIRQKQVLANSDDLKIFKNKKELVEELRICGIEPSKQVLKTRFVLEFEGQEIKIDFVNNKIYMEFDNAKIDKSKLPIKYTTTKKITVEEF